MKISPSPLAKVGYSSSLVFYDAMLPEITTEERMDNVSTAGYALGYIGSVIPFIVCLLVVLNAGKLGISTSTAMVIAFLLTAAWWVVCTVPLLKTYTQRAYSEHTGNPLTASFRRLGKTFRELGADLVMFDGALSRKTLCSRRVSQATVLCTGASYHKNLDVVVEDTAHICRMLTLPELDDRALAEGLEEAEDFRGLRLYTEQGNWDVPLGMSLEDALRKPEADGAKMVFFGGAMSDGLMKPLLMSGAPVKGLTFAVRDSSKILLKRENYEKMRLRGIELRVLESVNLVAVTVNPFSAYGFHFDKDELMERMQQRVNIPVINVEDNAV